MDYFLRNNSKQAKKIDVAINVPINEIIMINVLLGQALISGTVADSTVNLCDIVSPTSTLRFSNCVIKSLSFTS